MQMVKNFFIALLVVWLSLVILMPKKALYYKLEEVLETQSIKINEKKIEEGLFSLTLYGVDVYVKGIKLATIEKVNFFTLLLYTRMDIETLTLDDSLKNMTPTEISEVVASHGIWMPLKINIYAEGSFGKAEGHINIDEKNMRLDFNESKGIEMLKPNLKQDEKGWYYETSF